LFRFGSASLVGLKRDVLDESKEREGAPAIRDLSPEDGAIWEEGPVEHHEDEGKRTQARKQKLQVGCQRGVEGSGAQGRIAQEATETLVGGAVALGGTGEGAGEATQREGAAGEEGRAQTKEVIALVSVPRETQPVDKGTECGNMKVEHGLLLS
jgi:hypothetical protein